MKHNMLFHHIEEFNIHKMYGALMMILWQEYNIHEYHAVCNILRTLYKLEI